MTYPGPLETVLQLPSLSVTEVAMTSSRGMSLSSPSSSKRYVLFTFTWTHQSLIPSSVTLKTASPSGMLGESMSLAILFPALPFLRYTRKVAV